MKIPNDLPHSITAIARSAITNVIHEEGGFVDDPVDTGGKTRFGISQKAYPKLDIANLTREQAEQIYYQDYWLSIRGNRLPDAVAFIVFDAAVNMGVGRSAKLLQSAASVDADGVIGSRTLGMISTLDKPYLCKTFTDMRIRHYCKIVESNPTQSRFIFGWVSRAMRIRDHGLNLIGAAEQL